MKKLLTLALTAVVLSGCATYKFHHGQAPHDKGYVVSRDNYTILEYTSGENNTVPDRKLAKARFLRRRNIVEDYYKRMGYIQNHFTMAFWDPAVMFVKLVGGVFRLPFIAISDYRYEHSAAYQEKAKKAEQDKETQEAARIDKLKKQLAQYLEKALLKEKSRNLSSKVETEPEKEIPVAMPEETAQASAQSEAEAAKIKEETLEKLSEESRARAEEKAPLESISPESAKIEATPEIREERSSAQIRAVILAKPLKGFSPLVVHFWGNRSYSRKARIIYYSWDFGDGDTSVKINPVNTYYSGSFDPKKFTVTLTVRDNLGNTAKASTTITVMNR